MNLFLSLPAPTDVNDLIGVLGVILGITFIVIIALLIARFRSFLASIWFIPAMIELVAFLINRVPSIGDFFTSSGSFMNGVLLGLSCLYVPVERFHMCIVALLSNIASTNTTYINIISSDIFAFSLYLILFLIFFLVLHKRKKKKTKRYDDF